MNQWRNEILCGHVLAELAKVPAGLAQCCITSPPYWGLRAYGTEPQVWGGDDADCEHEWGDAIAGKQRSGGTESSTLGEASGGNAISDDAQKRSIERSGADAGTVRGPSRRGVPGRPPRAPG